VRLDTRERHQSNVPTTRARMAMRIGRRR